MTSNGKALIKRTEEAGELRKVMFAELEQAKVDNGNDYRKYCHATSKIRRKWYATEEG